MNQRSFGHGPMNFQAMSPVIKGLIITNLIVFVLQHLVGGQFISLFGLVPYRVTHNFWLWQPFTYLFLHAGILHLLFNLFALWMFGMPIESQWGGREFLKYVIICGVGAGLVSVAVNPSSPYPIIGASGAVYGLLVAFAMLFPEAVVYLYFFFPIKAKHMAILFCTLEFFASMGSGGGAVARFAHLGGALIGFLYIRYWNWASLYIRAFFREILSRGGGKRKRRVAEATRETTGLVDEVAEVDRILDKISSYGESALSESERDFLQAQARKRPKGHA